MYGNGYIAVNAITIVLHLRSLSQDDSFHHGHSTAFFRLLLLMPTA